MKNQKIFFTVAILLSTTLTVQAQDIVMGKEVVLHSAILSETRTILVSTPEGYDQSDKGYPVMYVLDADFNMLFTKGIVDYLGKYNMIPPMILVGIPNTSSRQRTRDYTLSRNIKYPNQFPGGGGSARFLDFITDELFPCINKRYRTNPYKILVGHSLGGLVIVNTLISRPETFDAYFSFSPSLWWNEEEYYPLAEQMLSDRKKIANRYLFITRANEGENNLAQLKRFVKLFKEKAPSSFKLEMRIIKEEDHITTAVESTLQALKNLYKDWRQK